MVVLLTSRHLVTSLWAIVRRRSSEGDKPHSGACCSVGFCGSGRSERRRVLRRGDRDRFGRERMSRIPEWLCRDR